MYELIVFTADGISKHFCHSIDLAQKIVDQAKCKNFRCVFKSSLALPQAKTQRQGAKSNEMRSL